MAARRRKAPVTNRDQVTDERREDRATTASGRRWCILLICVVTLCLGIYLVAPRNYKRTPLKYQEESPSSKDDVQKGEGVSSCESLMAAAKQLVDSNEARNLEPALDLVASCIVQDPNNTVALWNLAFILTKANRVDEAVMFIDNVLTLDPYNTQFHRSAGMLFYDFNQHREAVLALEKYFELLLNVPSWPHLLASLVNQREDEWSFLLTTEEKDIIDVFLRLLTSYLKEKLVLKTTYLYKVVIGLNGISNSKELLSPYAFLSMGLGDIATGIKYLRYDMEVQYVDQGFGNEEYAYEVVTAHSLRLLTAGFDANIVNMARHLLMMGDIVWDEYEYNCKLTEAEKIKYDTLVMQADIRKLFALCLERQGIISRLISEGAVVYAENRFGWTPLLNIASLGSVSILNEILPYSEGGPQSRTALGHTSLHIAAMKGSYDIIQPLVSAGLSPEEKDFRQKTALNVACSHQWTAQKISAALGRQKLPHGCLKKIPYLPPGKVSQGGWNDSPFELPAVLTEDKCEFDVVTNISSEDFLYRYLTLQRPVIVRNAINSKFMKNLFRKWQRDQFVKEYGTLKFKEVVVPYAESFGYNDEINKSTNLQDFAAEMDRFSQMGANKYPSQPPYIFEPVDEKSPLLEDFFLPTILDPELTHISISQVQFYMGPALSGAPGHFHRSAMNTLIYGKKRWFLYPPTEAFYSREHVWSWWQHEQPKPKGSMECVQYPGDLLFVPDMWGHAVLNLRECVGLAAEFIYGASEFSL